MEAVPRLPMLSFELKYSPDKAQFGPALKQYIASFYNEDPESYNTEIESLETLRNLASRPMIDVSGCQYLKKYYCQLHFLKSRFPMGEHQPAAVLFSWKDGYAHALCSITDIRFELMCVLYNIGALHTKLGASDTRTSADGMKMACTHFQCAAWAFQTLKENYHQIVPYMLSIQLIHFMQTVCLAQAQECILEKSMMDNRKATIIAKVAVQVVDFYKRSLSLLQNTEDSSFSDLVGSQIYKDWIKSINFKVSYHKSVALLFQGQQAEEQQKMGERVAFYQASCEQLDEARKLALSSNNHKELTEAIAFTSDVVEGKRKAAKNENEFIYHEEVPERSALQEVKGAALVKGIPFNVNDLEVSGPDIFGRLVPMEAHEASSLYSEKKAQMVRELGELIEVKDQALAEFMSSLQLDVFGQMKQASGLPQELVDRAAALSACPNVTQELVLAMNKLSNSFHDVEAMLTDIQELLREEEENEKRYQELMGKRAPSIIATDLSREAAKYREAHNKANDSNQNLHKAMTTHVANLKILAQPLNDLQIQIPSVQLPDSNIDEESLKEIETLIQKVDEMKNQRLMLWSQFREAVHKDDITSALVTRQPDQSLDDIFFKELEKHDQISSLIKQNLAAQENILKVFVDAYAKVTVSRRYLQDLINKRTNTVNALIASFDSYEDLLAKASKGIEFYGKLETNVSKLFQRIKSAANVNQEEREQFLMKNKKYDRSPINRPISQSSNSSTPKLKDYLESRKKVNFTDNNQTNQYYLPGQLPESQIWPPAIRPNPVGSEINDPIFQQLKEPDSKFNYNQFGKQYYDSTEQNLSERFANLSAGKAEYYNSYTPEQYQVQVSSLNYSDSASLQPSVSGSKTLTSTTNLYQPLSSSQYGQTGQMYQQYSLNDQNQYYNYNNLGLSGEQNYQNLSGNQSQKNEGKNEPLNSVSYQVGYGSAETQNQQINMMQSQIGQGLSQTSLLKNYGTTVDLPQNSASYQSSATQHKYKNMETLQSQTGYGTSVIQHSQQYATEGAPQFQGYNTGSMSLQSQDYVSPGTPQLQTYGAASYSPSGIPLSQPLDNLQSLPDQRNYNNYPISVAVQNIDTSGNSGLVHAGYGTAGTSQQMYNSLNTPYQQNVENKLESVQAQPSVPYNETTAAVYANYHNSNNIYYPSNYNQNQVTEDNNEYPSTFGTLEYASSVTPNISNTCTSTYSSPSIDMTSSNSASYANYPNYDQRGYGYDYYGSNYMQNQVYVTNHEQPSVSQVPSTPVVTTAMSTVVNTITDTAVSKESNIDLLTGLDFTIGQTPLMPQQNASTKKEEVVKNKNEKVPKVEDKVEKNHLNNEQVVTIFKQEVDKFEKYVTSLTVSTLSGFTALDLKWKEINDKQLFERKYISVAQSHIMKNRFPDILPYDDSRVQLKSTSDDYINASYFCDLPVPLIVTQAPLTSTFFDFWTMVYEQDIEMLVCLLNDSEMVNEVYWPTEKGKDLVLGTMVISLVNVNVKATWTERLLSILIPEKRESKVVMQFQFTAWPASSFPTQADEFTNFTLHILNLHFKQRNSEIPILLHCSSGIGRSGALVLLITAILEVTNNPTSLPDLTALTMKLSKIRRNILRDQKHLKFAYETFLAYMRQIVPKEIKKVENVEEPVISEEDVAKLGGVVLSKDASFDPLSSLDPFWASKKS